MTADDFLPIECNWPLDAGDTPLPPASWAGRYEELGAAVALPAGAATAETFLGGVPARMIAPAGHWADTTVLYFHGGWYAAGSPASHQGGAAKLAALAGSRLVLPGYRLAPAAPFPAAVHDAMSAYRGLLDFGTGPEQIVVAGDGAGAGLAAALLLALRDSGLGLPSAAVLFAPWADLADGPGRLADPVARQFTAAMASQYAGDTDRAHPFISPVHADLAGLPPLHVQVAVAGLLRADADRLAAAAGAAGVECELVHWSPDSSPETPRGLPGWPASAPASAAAFARAHHPAAHPAVQPAAPAVKEDTR